MNILLIDEKLPHSVFSGKTVRLKNIYGRLAKTHKIIFARTMPLNSGESMELETWAEETFFDCLRLPVLREPSAFHRLKTIFTLRPWYDIESKYPGGSTCLNQCLNELADKYEIDLVITFCIETAQYGSFLSKRMPWIQDLGDSLVLQVRRQLSKADNWKRKLYLIQRLLRETGFEREMVSRADASLFVAEDDAALYPHDRGNKIHIVPNGVDTDYFNPAEVQPHVQKNPYVIFTGHMSFPPNQDAAMYFAETIFPAIRKQLPNLHFLVVGADPSEQVKQLERLAGVVVTGRVPDIRPFLAGAQVFVCPMRMGSGIKNKILEAMSMKLPIVATDLAMKGIDAPVEGILMAETPEDFAAQTLKAIEMGKTPGPVQALRHFVMSRYSWNINIDDYEKIFAKVSRKND